MRLRLPGLKGPIVAHKVLTGGKVTIEPCAEGILLRMEAAQQDPLDTIVKLELDRPGRTGN
jgi:hypothetical protein